jgi:hypothetical protein
MSSHTYALSVLSIALVLAAAGTAGCGAKTNSTGEVATGEGGANSAAGAAQGGSSSVAGGSSDGGVGGSGGGMGGSAQAWTCPPDGSPHAGLFVGKVFDATRGCVGDSFPVEVCGCLGEFTGADSSTECIIGPDGTIYFATSADQCEVSAADGWYVEGSFGLTTTTPLTPTAAQETACAILRASSTSTGSYDMPGPPSCDGQSTTAPISANLCPPTPPAPGSPCTQWIECSYGEDPRFECRQTFVCSVLTGSTWQATTTTLTCPAPTGPGVGCPTTHPAIGTDCGVGPTLSTGGCGFDDGTICDCDTCAKSGCAPTDGWQCTPPPGAPCPAIAPNLGTACTQENGMTCAYGTPTLRTTLICAASVWHLVM